MNGSKYSSAPSQLILFVSILIVAIALGIYIGFNGVSLPIIVAFVGLPFVFLSVSKPWIALSVFFLSVPLVRIYTFEGGLETITKLVGVYLVVLVVITGSFRYINEVFKNKKIFWMLLFCGIGLVSITYSKNVSHSMGYLISLALSIISYFVLVMMIRDLRILNISMFALLTGGVISILSPLVLGIGRVGGSKWERYGGLWGDQNTFAAILLVLIPISLCLFYMSKKRLFRIIFASYSVILLLGFILTFSRGVFLAFGAMIIVALFKFVKSKNRIKILAIATPCLIIAFAVFYHTIADQFIKRVETLQVLESRESVSTIRSLNTRYYNYFDLSPKLFAENPILGVGFRGFILDNKLYNKVAHNTYLEVLIGTGLVGFIPFIIILLLTWRELRKLGKLIARDRETVYISLYANALELGFISYLIAALFISLDTNKMTWLIVALPPILLNIHRIGNSANNRKPDMQRNPSYGYF